MKRIYLVRHGESEGNVQKIYQGPDVPLSPDGHRGAKAVAERIATLEIDEIIASHFVRAQQTAGHISEKIEKEITTVESFHEVLNAQSVWGKSLHDEETADYVKERKEQFTNPEWNIDGAENYFDVWKRIKDSVAFLENIAAKNIVVVSHGNFLRLLASFLLVQKTTNVEEHMCVYNSLQGMSNVGITEFFYDEGEWRLFIWNDHAHFAE